MTDYPLRGGVCVNGLPVAGIYHAGRRIGLTHDGHCFVPSGKNLLCWSEMTAFDGLVKTAVTDDGGLHVKAKAGLHCWCGISWDIPLSDIGVSPGDTLTASLADDEQLGGGMLLNLKFLTDSYGSYTAQQNFGWGNVEVMTIPEDTITIQFTVMATTDISADLSKTIHPQLERGSARTCWEPPENLRGGGVLKDLNLCGAWDNWGSKFPTWEVSGHTAHVARPDTATKWQARKMSAVTLPAGTYSVRVDITGDAGLAFEVHVGGRVAFYAGSDWRRFTLDQPTEVYVQLAVRPTWTGEATLTPVILEGDWTTT